MTDHLRMLGLVALVVATVILLFFTVGYVLGRILLCEQADCRRWRMVGTAAALDFPWRTGIR